MNAPVRTDLHALLDHPEQVAQVPPEHRQELLDALAVHEGRCRVVRDLLTAPLIGTATAGNPQETTLCRYVTQAEAAAMFNIPLSTVRYLTRRGRVPALGKGKNRRLLPADLARELEDCKRTGRTLRPGGKPARRPLTVTVPLE